MGHRDGAVPLRLVDELHRAGQLGRDAGGLDPAARRLPQPPEHADVRLAQEGAVLCALLGGVEEGPLHVDAEEHRAAPVGVARGVLVDRGERLLRQRHRRGRDGGHAVFALISGNRVERLVGAVAEIIAAAAVGVDIDQPGKHEQPRRVDRTAARRFGEQLPFHRDVPFFKGEPFGIDLCVFDNHLEPPSPRRGAFTVGFWRAPRRPPQRSRRCGAGGSTRVPPA